MVVTVVHCSALISIVVLMDCLEPEYAFKLLSYNIYAAKCKIDNIVRIPKDIGATLQDPSINNTSLKHGEKGPYDFNS